jgi:hypothetical protein
LQEAKAAIREAIRRGGVFSDILVAEGGRLNVPQSKDTTDITTKIRQFAEGTLDEAGLVDYLTEKVRYKPTDSSPHPRGTAEWYQWHEQGRQYVPGSFDEVRAARDSGLLPSEVYKKIAGILWKRSVPIGEDD